MPSKARRIFQWFNVCLVVLCISLLDLQAASMILHPSSSGHLVIAWLFLALSTLPLASLAWFLLKRRST